MITMTSEEKIKKCETQIASLYAEISKLKVEKKTFTQYIGNTENTLKHRYFVNTTGKSSKYWKITFNENDIVLETEYGPLGGKAKTSVPKKETKAITMIAKKLKSGYIEQDEKGQETEQKKSSQTVVEELIIKKNYRLL